MIAVGEMAPEFSLPNQAGRVLSLRTLRGSWVILYFYPKDFTSGCTRQACSFRDSMKEVERDIVVLGVSPDGLQSHAEFHTRLGLPFDLLTDADLAVSRSYGVWTAMPPSFRHGEWIDANGGERVWMGTRRSTFTIAPDGRIAAIDHDVDPDTGPAAAITRVKERR